MGILHVWMSNNIFMQKKQNNMVCAFCAQSFAAQDQHKLLSEVFSWGIKKLSGTYQTHQKNRKYFFSITGKLSVFKITTQQMKLRAIHKDKKLKRDTYFELSYYNRFTVVLIHNFYVSTLIWHSPLGDLSHGQISGRIKHVWG